MKILCLSDLHLRMNDVLDAIHQKRLTPFLQSIRDLAEDTKPVRLHEAKHTLVVGLSDARACAAMR